MENESGTESESGFNLHEAAEEIISNESQAESTPATSTEGQAETTPNQTGDELARAEAILNGKEEPTKTEINPELISQINALGAIHNGLPIKIDSPDQLKEMLQKGVDYTKKTMAHADEVKARQEEFSRMENTFKERETQYAQKEQELHGVSFQNNVVNSMVDKWKESDPELYQYIQDAFQREIADFQKNQPIIAQYENRFKQFEDKFAQLEQGKHQSALGEIKGSWEKQLNEVQTAKSAKLKELGVTPNWDKVKEIWGADATNKMTVEQALLSVHGSDMIKAAESQMKKLKAAAEVSARKLNRGGVGSSQKAGVKIAAPVGDYNSIIRQSLEQL